MTRDFKVVSMREHYQDWNTLNTLNLVSGFSNYISNMTGESGCVTRHYALTSDLFFAVNISITM